MNQIGEEFLRFFSLESQRLTIPEDFKVPETLYLKIFMRFLQNMGQMPDDIQFFLDVRSGHGLQQVSACMA